MRQKQTMSVCKLHKQVDEPVPRSFGGAQVGPPEHWSVEKRQIMWQKRFGWDRSRRRTYPNRCHDKLCGREKSVRSGFVPTPGQSATNYLAEKRQNMCQTTQSPVFRKRSGTT